MAHSWLLLGAVAECKPAYTFPCLACKYLIQILRCNLFCSLKTQNRGQQLDIWCGLCCPLLSWENLSEIISPQILLILYVRTFLSPESNVFMCGHPIYASIMIMVYGRVVYLPILQTYKRVLPL